MNTKIGFTLDGQTLEAAEGETIWQCAERAGIDIPHLCYSKAPDYRADGNCRVCMVEVEGERVLAASCIRTPTEGMVVHSSNERAATARKMVMELLVADQPPRESSHDPNSELWHWAEEMGQTASRFPARRTPAADISHTAMAVNLDACIHCTRCVRACREVQVNDVIGMAGRGAGNKIVFDFDDAMGSSSCVACGECVQACPTRALMPARGVGKVNPDKKVESVCPYCGVGCQLTFNVKDNKILSVEGRDGPSNSERLCVKGRFGFDYVNHDHRLTKPLIRRSDAPAKTADIDLDPANPYTHFRDATWEEALDFAAEGLTHIRDASGGKALAGLQGTTTSLEIHHGGKLVVTGNSVGAWQAWDAASGQMQPGRGGHQQSILGIAVSSQDNQRLATAGSGDVLAGIIGALIGYAPTHLAVAAAAHWHGRAAALGQSGMIASDLPSLLQPDRSAMLSP